MEQNIFVALSKYNSAVDENYLTESFVFLLNSLLKHDPSACLDILRKLCVENNEFNFYDDEAISITTQKSTEKGRPDITISAPGKKIYIEVKHDSGLGYQQIERYKAALEQSKASIRKVILLTRFAIDLDEEQGKPDKHVRWFEIYNWLLKVKVDSSINKYLIENFLKFLEVKKMSMQKITSEYINGIPVFRNLINMLGVAIESQKLKVEASGGWRWMGFYFDKNNENFCGVYYDNLSRIEFDYHCKKKDVRKFYLNLEELHFFL
ncbi:MAG: PD-(D/E)XK nuclease family protein [Candidatus Omnitrophica bacterium]|nr:PD-(D/E)XK nuclease family protein [Candidatus Omnitrophota bacterium]MBU1047037.1 PD-(D/E)XK nuclease family protein [Candidatus Omnitrophota bacterium]MBU1630713.1 PD-(D/E)XK nuclease family protein [Candidatus Omnitrophota bacterium]MBU1889293.1 PD-(D/E)XK nuclease family protein [Candidatus Omnitrophota bacterium]